MPNNEAKEKKEESQIEDLLRKEALAQISVPDQLNILFMTVTYKKKLIKIASLIFVLAFLCWILFGSIPISINGKGIVMNSKGIFNLEAKTEGTIAQIYIAPGQIVHKGQLLMRLSDPDIEYKYQYSLKKIQSIQEDVTELKLQIQSELEAQKKSYVQQMIDTKNTISNLEKSIPKLESELKTKEWLFQQHLLGLNQLYEAKQTIAQQKIVLESAKGALVNLQANLQKSYRQQELISKENDLLQAQQENALLKTQLEELNILNTNEGIVLEILGNPGDIVAVGNPLIRIEYGTVKQQYVIYAYIPEAVGKRIQNNTPVLIELSNVRSEEYGAMLGKVVQYSLYPVSPKYIGKTIQNEGLVDYLMAGNKTVIQLIIEPEIDSSTYSGYKWTSGKGPRIKISTGIVCTVKGLVTHEPPIVYFISLWRLGKLQTVIEKYLQAK